MTSAATCSPRAPEASSELGSKPPSPMHPTYRQSYCDMVVYPQGVRCGWWFLRGSVKTSSVDRTSDLQGHRQVSAGIQGGNGRLCPGLPSRGYGSRERWAYLEVLSGARRGADRSLCIVRPPINELSTRAADE